MVRENILDIKELDISISKSIKGNFIYIKDVYVNNESYEYKILMEQEIENVNKMQIEYDGNKVNLKYDISNKVTLDNYLMQKKLNVPSLLHIVKSINNLINSIENYLLSENSITLDFRTIVIDKVGNSVRLKFCLVPNLNNDFSYELSKFLMKLLRYIDINDKNALPLAYKLFIKSAKDNYTIDDLIDVVTQYEEDNEALYDVYDENIIFDEKMLLSNDNENKEEFYDIQDVYSNDTNDKVVYEADANLEETKKDLRNDENSLNFMNTKNTLVIDDETKKLLNSFDEEEDMVIKNNKNKKKEVVNAHIKINPLKRIFMPLISLAVPLSLYFSLSKYEFSKVLPLILLFECMLLIITIVNAFKRIIRR